MGENNSEIELTTQNREVAISATPIYIGDELHLDVWVRPQLGTPKSILIRSINEAGEVKSAFLHIDEEARLIPTFSDDVDLTKKQENTSPKKSKVPKAKKYRAPRKQRRGGKIVEIGSTVLALGLLGLFLAGALQASVVLTGSMKPTINPGDIVIAESTKYITPHKGEVAIYSARDLQGRAVSYWSHRIIGGDAKSGFEFKGDANPAPDIRTVPLSDVKSVVLFKIPAIGKYLNPWTVLLIGSGLILLTYTIRLMRQDN